MKGTTRDLLSRISGPSVTGFSFRLSAMMKRKRKMLKEEQEMEEEEEKEEK